MVINTSHSSGCHTTCAVFLDFVFFGLVEDMYPLTAMLRFRLGVLMLRMPLIRVSFAIRSMCKVISFGPGSSLLGCTKRPEIFEVISQGTGTHTRRSRSTSLLKGMEPIWSEYGYCQSPSSCQSPLTDPRTSTFSRVTPQPGLTFKAQ